MKRHTPGPWLVHGYRIYGPEDPRSKHATGRVLIGGVVDSIHDWYSTPRPKVEASEFMTETEANVRLMAMAPELLGALEDMLAYWRRELAGWQPAAQVERAAQLIARLR